MPSRQSVEAAMRVYAALVGNEEVAGGADLFAATVVEAGQELAGGFEDLAAGLLQVVAVLTELVATQSGTKRSTVVQAVGLALARGE
ncbi:hypothetical protein KM427_15925 [Nocardioides sp. LMS-CY]|uniref:hypothetical protein n=1 Tax=Nocardioides sp. (strain LMS-CY) TaxID=2840457 RepID=UPI001BFFF184|nr:hypothetical protein [Nocardioides sp. LMS-CY]QWF20470.1 hypothetical protein KM427_15925 [Nocardioides sp. LMS-CY]